MLVTAGYRSLSLTRPEPVNRPTWQRHELDEIKKKKSLGVLLFLARRSQATGRLFHEAGWQIPREVVKALSEPRGAGLEVDAVASEPQVGLCDYAGFFRLPKQDPPKHGITVGDGLGCDKAMSSIKPALEDEYERKGTRIVK
jgi:hypothetical protein